MLTLGQMMNAVNNRGDLRPIAIIRTTPLIGNKSFTVKAEARGTKLYSVTITFYNVDYSLERDPEHPLTVIAEVGHRAYMEPITMGGHPAQIRCSCEDFKFSYATWNRKEKSLSGRAFPSYERKTDTRPERNVQQIPGMCKHVLSLIDRLRKDRILF
jgi:hypothetical protein